MIDSYKTLETLNEKILDLWHNGAFPKEIAEIENISLDEVDALLTLHGRNPMAIPRCRRFSQSAERFPCASRDQNIAKLETELWASFKPCPIEPTNGANQWLTLN